MSQVEIIRDRLQKSLSPTFLEVTDESDQHIGHAGHQAGGRHFAIKISAAAFEQKSKIEAHRQIYALLTDLMPLPIHALKIQIIQ